MFNLSPAAVFLHTESEVPATAGAWVSVCSNTAWWHMSMPLTYNLSTFKFHLGGTSDDVGYVECIHGTALPRAQKLTVDGKPVMNCRHRYHAPRQSYMTLLMNNKETSGTKTWMVCQDRGRPLLALVKNQYWDTYSIHVREGEWQTLVVPTTSRWMNLTRTAGRILDDEQPPSLNTRTQCGNILVPLLHSIAIKIKLHPQRRHDREATLLTPTLYDSQILSKV